MSNQAVTYGVYGHGIIWAPLDSFFFQKNNGVDLLAFPFHGADFKKKNRTFFVVPGTWECSCWSLASSASSSASSFALGCAAKDRPTPPCRPTVNFTGRTTGKLFLAASLFSFDWWHPIDGWNKKGARPFTCRNLTAAFTRLTSRRRLKRSSSLTSMRATRTVGNRNSSSSSATTITATIRTTAVTKPKISGALLLSSSQSSATTNLLPRLRN